jgi:hypothetical protein
MEGGITDHLPNSMLIAGAVRIVDMIWIWVVFGLLISPES